MKAVIFAGGQGTRLAPYNIVLPKPLVPLGDRPILDIVIQQLAHHGFDRIVLSVGYLAELIEAYYRDGARRSARAEISFVRESEPLGTCGPLALVPELTETFLVMNGDILTTLDYTKLVTYHHEQGGILTIALSRRPVKIDLGVVELDDRNVITRFVEKPTLHYRASMGIYVYEPAVLDFIEPGERLDFPEMVWRLLDAGKKVVGYPCDDYWLDLGSHEDYRKAQDEFEQMRARLLPGEPA